MIATAFATGAEVVKAPSGHFRRREVCADLLAQRMLTGPVRTIAAKEHVFREGDRATHVYMVEVGHVCIYRTLSDGRRQVIDFAYPGDLIGLGAIGEHKSNAQATTRTILRCLPTGALLQAVREDGLLGLEMCEALSRELNASRELLFTVSQRNASERVASFLIALSRRNERNGEDPLEFVLPMTRNDIADFLGLTIETVSRTFTRLRSAGVIGLTQSVLVTIRDPDALAEMAGGQGG